MQFSPAARPIKPRILVIEDDRDTADLVMECLNDFFEADVATLVENAADACAFDVGDVDLVLSDMNLPDGNGLEIMETLLKKRADLPIVFVTGENILGNAIHAIRNGAYDYVVKAGNYLFSIPVVVEKNLELWRIKRQNEQLQRQLEEKMEEVEKFNQKLTEQNEQLETIAATDPLTGLANRRSLNSSLDARFAESTRGGSDLACLMMDLDGFKQLNDTAGHPAGDRVLKCVAEAIENNCRRSDVAGRFGGDEFILVLPSTDLAEAEAAAERIRTDFAFSAARECERSGYTGSVSISMGLATLRANGADSPEALISQADQALYAAKKRGKKCLVVFDPSMDADVVMAA